MRLTLKKVIAFGFIFSVCNSLHAQKQGQALIDSLLQELPKQKEDTNKVNLLTNLSFYYSDVAPVQGISYGQKALDVAIKLKWEKGIANAYNRIGVNFDNKSDYENSLKYYFESLCIYENIKYKKGIASINGNIGIIYMEKGEYPKALEFNLKSLAINEELGNKKGVASCDGNIASVYYLQGNFPKALEYYLKQLGIAEEIKSKMGIAAAMGNISGIYSSQKDHPEALEYDFKSLKIQEEIGNKNGVANTTGNIGNIYNYLRNPSKALEYYYKALKMQEELGNKNEVAIVSENIGDIYIDIRRYAEAIAYEDTALKLSKETGATDHIAYELQYIGRAYLTNITDPPTRKGQTVKLPENVSQKTLSVGRAKCLSLAIDYLQQGLIVSKEISSLVVMEPCYEYLSVAYKLKGDYKLALEYADNYHAIKDSIFSKENDKKIITLGVQNEYDRKHFADSLKTDEKEKITGLKMQRQRSYMYFGLGGILLLSAFSGFSIYNYNRRKKLSFAKKVSETEMTALRAQMNPHFIFNALNSIHTYIQANNNKIASSYLLQFSALTRLILENSMHQFIPLADEMQAMELYLSLERLRLGGKLQYEIIIAPDIDKDNTLIPPLMLQPFIENAILHGLQNKENGGKINIQVSRQGDMICCTITDDGIGRQKASEVKLKNFAGKKESLGMKLTEQRIAIINNMKKSKAYVTITDVLENNEPAGVKVELVLPLELRF